MNTSNIIKGSRRRAETVTTATQSRKRSWTDDSDGSDVDMLESEAESEGKYSPPTKKRLTRDSSSSTTRRPVKRHHIGKSATLRPAKLTRIASKTSNVDLSSDNDGIDHKTPSDSFRYSAKVDRLAQNLPLRPRKVAGTAPTKSSKTLAVRTITQGPSNDADIDTYDSDSVDEDDSNPSSRPVDEDERVDTIQFFEMVYTDQNNTEHVLSFSIKVYPDSEWGSVYNFQVEFQDRISSDYLVQSAGNLFASLVDRRLVDDSGKLVWHQELLHPGPRARPLVHYDEDLPQHAALSELQIAMQNIYEKNTGAPRKVFEKHSKQLSGDKIMFVEGFKVADHLRGTGFAQVAMKAFLSNLPKLDVDALKFDGTVVLSPGGYYETFEQKREQNGGKAKHTFAYVSELLIKSYQKSGYEVYSKADNVVLKGNGLHMMGIEISEHLAREARLAKGK